MSATEVYTADHVRELIKAVQADSTLTAEQKTEIVQKLQDKSFVTKLNSGAAGVGIGLLIGKYLKLSTTAKVLLSIAGYGIGRSLWTYLHTTKESKFQSYNSKLKSYEIR